MTGLHFREATSEDGELIVKFSSLDDLEHYHWEYWRYRPELSLYGMAFDGDKLIGSEALWPYYLNINGRKIMTARSERTLVDPACRGRDVWVRLMDYCADWGVSKNHAFIWGSTKAEKPFRRAGFKYITGFRLYLIAAIDPGATFRRLREGDMPVSLRPSEIMSVVKTKNMIKGLEYAKLFSAIPSMLIKVPLALVPSSAPPGLEVREESDPRELKALFEKLRDGGKMVYLEPERELDQWLFARGSHPHFRLYAYRGGELVAYVIVETKNSALASVIDFAATDHRAFRHLLRRARHQLKERGHQFVYVAVNWKNPQQRKLIPHFCLQSFIPFYWGGRWVIRPLGFKDNTVIEEIKLWYVTDLWYLM